MTEMFVGDMMQFCPFEVRDRELEAAFGPCSMAGMMDFSSNH